MAALLRTVLVTKIIAIAAVLIVISYDLTAAEQKKESALQSSSPGLLDKLGFPKPLQDIVKEYAGIVAVPLKGPASQNLMHDEYYVSDAGEITTTKPSTGSDHEQIVLTADNEPGSYQILDAEKKYSALVTAPAPLSNTFRVSVKSHANGKEAVSFTTESPRHHDLPIAFFAQHYTHYFITGEYQKNSIVIKTRTLPATPQKEALPEILYTIKNVVTPTKVNGYNSPKGRYLLVLNDTTPLMLKITDPLSAAEELASDS